MISTELNANWGCSHSTLKELLKQVYISETERYKSMFVGYM